MNLRGEVERFFVSESGLFAVLGWCADEGAGNLDTKILGSDFGVEIPSASVLRHARPDIEQAIRPGAFDYGFAAVGRAPSRTLLKQATTFSIVSDVGALQDHCEPEFISDKRFLDTLLIFLKNAQSHAGRECRLYQFLSAGAGSTLTSAFDQHVVKAGKEVYVESFGKRRVTRSFVTVLFGSSEPILVQPILFHKAGIDFGEWIYACNSPEDGNTLLRIARLLSSLYGIFITVIVLGDNVGFAAANNVAIAHASGVNIYIINPDVYPAGKHIDRVVRTLEQRPLDNRLWGGLLFYDDYNLMHSGMHLDRDRYFACKTGQDASFAVDAPSHVALLRVEHFDKGVPFDSKRWVQPKLVPLISGAVMAFGKAGFERLGGFSNQFIYGHYEDADLSIRWANQIGEVLIDPDLRLVHLEGQGSRARGEQFGSAATINRVFFSMKYNDAFDRDPDRFSTTSDWTAGGVTRQLSRASAHP